MHDITAIRANPTAFDEGLKKRGLAPQSAEILKLDGQRRQGQTNAQELQTLRNKLSKEIGEAKKARDEARAQMLMSEVKEIKEKLAALETKSDGEADGQGAGSEELHALLSSIPNLPADDVPLGPDETANVEIRRVGTPRAFSFTPKEHDALGGALMDFEAGARLSGARFVVLRGVLARLERALAAFMLDLHTQEFGYTEAQPPLLVRDGTMFGTAQLPKFRDDQFQTTDGFWLIPTAEVPLTNLVREQILDESQLPLRYTAWTPCFRREAGAAGRDTRGMIRQHQFDKVELVSVTTPDTAEAEHRRMTECAEEVLKRLELPYRVLLLCSGDMGFSAKRTFDLEVWLPGQGAYREISSCSWCGDFQGRRMDARYRPKDGKGTRYVHTLNGSGLAVGRTLVAVLENYQDADGSVTVPAVLRPYMGGRERIEASVFKEPV